MSEGEIFLVEIWVIWEPENDWIESVFTSREEAQKCCDFWNNKQGYHATLLVRPLKETFVEGDVHGDH